VVRGIDMRARVGDGLDLLDRPAKAIGPSQIFGLHAKQLLHLAQPLRIVSDIADLGRHRLADGVVFERHAQIDKAALAEHGRLS